MPLLGRLIGGARALLRPKHVEREMDDELRAYLEMEVEHRMAVGMSRSQALRAARVAMGGVEVVKDRVRDAGWESIVDSLWQDVQYAIRGLRAAPGFSIIAIVTLALGIGANSAVFSVVNTLLLRTLPVTEPGRLVTITATRGVTTRLPEDIWTYGIWNAIRQRSQAFDRAFAWSAVPLNLAQGGETAVVDGLFASGDYFTALGVPALIGRTFTAEDDVRGGGPTGPVAVISYGLWQRRFGGIAAIVGTPIVVEHIPFTIVGVTPPEFFGVEVGRAFDVAVPIGTEPLINGKNSILDEVGFWLTVMLRLKPGQSPETATAALRSLQPQIREAAMPTHGPPGFERDFLTGPFVLIPAGIGTSRLREQYARPLLAILVVVAIVLLVACVNLANLLIARAAARRHEYSVRTALGAPRGRLVRQSLAECLILAGAGAVIGLAIGAWGGRALVSQLSNHVDRLSLTVALDWRVLAFTMAVAVATALFFGTAAALRSARALPIEAIKTQTHGADVSAAGLPPGLIVGQVALALVLVVVGGLFVRTFERLATLPRGFNSDRVLLVRVDATRAQPDPAARLRFYDRLIGA
ncbi:MAG TPA: ABC transporter permease, partial [Vicinamibacterales bacterium]|nr:ABC transporter permease [Vicinamibacterales bacterium]